MMSDTSNPLVTIVITTRNRSEELQVTLRNLHSQDYQPIELIVIDDCSDQPLELLVIEEWPGAKIVRNVSHIGLIASRSLGMKMASGEFIVSLDDDSCFTDPRDLTRAVSRMIGSPTVGIITFLVHHGPKRDEALSSSTEERFVHTFIGCGHVVRKAVVEHIGGYRDFYEYYAEENEYSLRVLDRGWRILFLPTVVVHHRVSSIGRNNGRVWGYSFRNNLWTVFLHVPAARLPMEFAWKLCIGILEAARTLRFRWCVWALASTFFGLPRVLQLRAPISPRTIHIYDRLRFGVGFSPDAKLDVPPVTWRQRWDWLVTNWWHRRRGRPFWDRRHGGIGQNCVARFSDTPQS